MNFKNHHYKNVAVLILLLGFSYQKINALPNMQKLVSGFLESEIKEKLTSGFFLVVGSYIVFNLIRSTSTTAYDLIASNHRQGEDGTFNSALNGESDRKKIIEFYIAKLPAGRLDPSLEREFLLTVLYGLTDGFKQSDLMLLVSQANALACEEDYVTIYHFTLSVNTIKNEKLA